MKKVIIVSLVLSVFCLSFAIMVSLAEPIALPELTPEAAVTPSAEPSASPSATPQAEYVYEDDGIYIKVNTGKEIVTMTMSEYLTGVVAAEMPASFGIEALRAQAVAARTVALNHMLGNSCQTNPEADVCADSTCCQAYLSDSELRQNWGSDYNMYMAKISQAIQSTDGECLVYDNTPIQAVFHSSSAGMTAESGEVWTSSLPYLVSVSSPETSENVPNYVSSVTVSLPDFKQTVLDFYPDAVFTANTSTWVTDITYTQSGRIGTVRLGGVKVTGPVLRSIFGLRSTAASIAIGENNIVFTTTGYGHGVGMSQYGANAYAQQGKNYRDILTWYYTGASFGDEKDYTNN